MSQVATSPAPMSVPTFRSRKGSGTPLVVLTAYDVATTLAVGHHQEREGVLPVL